MIEHKPSKRLHYTSGKMPGEIRYFDTPSGPGHYEHWLGVVYESDGLGGLVCIDPGRITFSTRWPEDARAEIRVLRAALKRIADGESDAPAIAREALGSS